MAKKKTTLYTCQACGYESAQWYGRCPQCGAWNQMEEEVIRGERIQTPEQHARLGRKKNRPQVLKEIQGEEEARVLTDQMELNRVLGGGVVLGSLVLLGGDPGIGKSTLLLQIAMQLEQQNKTVLYVAGEESLEQIKMRAERLGFTAANFYVYAETDMEEIEETILDLKPDFVMIDSIQTMVHQNSNGLAGSVSQVREATQTLMGIAKGLGIAVFIVGHVTKQGNIAGPRMLEHMVDTVLYLEGDKYNSFRILRAVKNRFGSTNEIGVFDMQEDGLHDVLNPSQLFLEERLMGANGSAVVASLEGTRTILTEIQALLTPTAFGNAKRTSKGLDSARVSLLIAVLEKRANLLMQNQDAYLKSTGGVKLDEPAIDLAIAVALASSYFEQETLPTDCFVGELGLTGEIRRVSRINERILEAEKLGFERIFVPEGNLSQDLTTETIEVIGARTLLQVIKEIFPKND